MTLTTKLRICPPLDFGDQTDLVLTEIIKAYYTAKKHIQDLSFDITSFDITCNL